MAVQVIQSQKVRKATGVQAADLTSALKPTENL